MQQPPMLPRIAIIDHHDSYTRNLLSLITQSIEPAPDAETLANRVVVLPYTHPILTADRIGTNLLPHVDALILSPGPGNPHSKQDFGTSMELLRAQKHAPVPVLGICLGHQGIAVADGAKVVQLATPIHGRRHALSIDSDARDAKRAHEMLSIMENVPQGTEVVCYNSLVVDEKTLPPVLRVLAHSQSEQGPLVQAIEHTELPYFGVQFHPESIESDGGATVLRNFFHNVAAYWKACDKQRVAQWVSPQLRLSTALIEVGGSCVAPSRPLHTSTPRWEVVQKTFLIPTTVTLHDTLAHVMPALFQKLCRTSNHRGPMASGVWLDSASVADPQSQLSMMGRADFTLHYDMHGSLAACVQNEDASISRAVLDANGSLWDWLGNVQRVLQSMTKLPDAMPMDAAAGGSTCAFCTGFVGFWSYEMKDESLHLRPFDPTHYGPAGPREAVDRMQLPAAQWSFCNTTLSLDQKLRTWTAYALVDHGTEAHLPSEMQTLTLALAQLPHGTVGISHARADEWLARVEETLLEVCNQASPSSETLVRQVLPPLHAVDNKQTYQDKIGKARQLIGAGESYELCLTTQFEGRVPELDSHNYDAHFALYCKLRRKNPAPFSAYIELLPTATLPQAILSTSPERFLTVTREGYMEMRPIKGTLPKAGFAKGEEDWLERAHQDTAFAAHVQAEDERRKAKLNADPKERAENLMIVDLIRADLQSVCFPGSVQVPRLIALESYATVHQLVTAVTGILRPGIGCVEATKRCFPPGSMTGAPKHRSVELLDDLERAHGGRATRRRAAYSGALGFISVDGASNMSVVIRTVTTQGSGALVGAGG
ncbi:Pab1p [Malassezia vespertilionis]|uniref:aminodeoxychorismate synthase n=2 Tax=Malassezia vespertilionis TaxID=2020962 RepID=A0A2N1J9C6_9BASI|nr:Pab1p [Malassezia vespertilionis]